MLDDFLHGFDLKIASQDAGHGFGPDRNRETKRKKLTHKNWKLLLADDGGPSLYSEALATQLPSRTSPKLLGFEKVVNRERGDRTIANINKHKHFFSAVAVPINSHVDPAQETNNNERKTATISKLVRKKLETEPANRNILKKSGSPKFHACGVVSKPFQNHCS